MSRVLYGVVFSIALFFTGCADAGKDQNVVSNTEVTLDANASKADFTGEIKKYRWKQTEGKKVKLSSKKAIKPTFTAPNVSGETVLTFRLTTVEKGGFYSPWRTLDEVSITVKPSASDNLPPTAVVIVNQTSVKYGESVLFDANNSTDSDGEIVAYEWKDENNVTLGSEVTLEHTFGITGTHTVTLTVTDNEELNNTTDVSVTVEELQPPVADINYTADTIFVGESITFDANNSTDADGQIVSYQWLDESNTTRSNQKSLTHTFSASGEYTITLVVMDDDEQEGRAFVNVVVEAQLVSIELQALETSLEENEETTLTAIAHYNDNSTLEVTSNVEWIIADTDVLSIDANGTLQALQSGTTTLQAKIEEILSNRITIEVKPPVTLASLSITPNPINLRVGTTIEVTVKGLYSDGTTQVVEDADYTITDTNIASVDGTGTIEGITDGTTTFSAKVGEILSSVIDVTVGTELNTTNFNFTNFGSTYTNQIPVDATKDTYDEKRFCMIAGQILAEDGSPLSGVKVSIHQHSEYGSTLTDSNGTYVIPAEGGLQLTMRYTKLGYTTIDRNIDAPIQDWVRSPDVTMLEEDSKVTQIDLNTTTAQMHVSTPVTDERGERSTTLVFDGVSRATVTAPDGSARVLTNIAVRATEFKTPKSMPSDLPTESAYTYCSDLKIDGTNDNDEITFDAPVVMYVDNFLGFEVGEIVPVGYYDRNAGVWKASDNGAVVRLLDTNSDGIVDAVDSTGDDLPNDLDGDGSFEDEVAGLQDNPNYVVGKTYWRAEMMHFTPWDHNWPYGPPSDAVKPKQDKPKSDDDEPNDCKVNVKSYVTGKSRVFHEDIPVAGTNITLHYSSKRVEGYNHIIDASIDTDNLPTSIQGATVTLNVAGRRFTKTPELTELDNLQFDWDGKDALGKIVSGEVQATITVSYTYQVVYLRGSSSFASAWARVGGATTGVRGRSAIQISNSKSITINVNASQDNNAYVAKGWTLSNIHSLGINAVYKGNATKIEKDFSSLREGLVAYYKFEDNVRDSSGLNYHGVLYGALTYVDCMVGRCAQFNGTQRIKIPHTILNQTGEQTVSFWMETTSTSKGILSGANYTNSNAYLLYVKSGRMAPHYITTGGESFYIGDIINTGEMTHITVVTTKSKTSLYINGVLNDEVNTGIGNNLTISSNGLWIGADQDSVGGRFESRQNFIGKLDEFKIYNKALSENDIEDIYLSDVNNITLKTYGLDISDNNLEYQFSVEGQHLATKTYPDKKTLETYTYDENGYVVTITDRFAQTTTITRDSEGNPIQITAPNGQVTTLTVDEQGDLTEVNYEDNSKYSFTYFDGSLVDIMTDPNGNEIQHFFDENGRIVEEVDGEGGSYRFLRNVTGNETFYSTILPEGETSTSSDIVLANGDTQSTMTLPTGEMVTATFAKDEKSTSSLRDGVSTAYTYTVDTLTQQKTLASKEITQPSGLKNRTTYTTTYDGNETHTNIKTQNITNNAKTTTLVTDYSNGISTLTTPTGRSATSTYDINTLLTTQSSTGTLTPTTYTYDAKGRVTQETTGSRSIDYTYDSRGNLATVTNPRGEVTSYSYDIVDNLTSVIYPNSTTEHFSYDKNGNLLTRTVPTPADHTFTYNGVDVRTNYTSPENKATTYSYDKSKNITAITKPSGKAITNTYKRGRLVSTTTPEGTTTYSYIFADKVGSISQGSESFSFTYDGILLTSMVQSGVLSHTTDYTYNNDFQVTSTTYAGTTENYSYDNDGLLTSSGRYTLTRDAQNAYTTQVTDGTLTQSRSYNGFGEVTEVNDNTFMYELTQRDNAGAITQKKETLNGVTTTYDYTFNTMGRLIQVEKDNSIVETYTYDNNGNGATATVNGTSTTASYTLDDQLEVYGDNTYRYDEDGYLEEKITPDGTTTYSYGAMGELLSVTTPTQSITYQHNANNQRVAKLINGTVVEKYLWANLTTLLAVYDNNDNLVQRFEYADQRMPIAMTQGSTKYYLHYDQVGSLRAVTDASHNIVKEIIYDTYGNILADSNEAFTMPLGFAGGLYDSDTKLIRFGYRDYDTYTGKWTAKDPIGFDGGDSNLYGYVLGDPVDFVDPNGLVTKLCSRPAAAAFGLVDHHWIETDSTSGGMWNSPNTKFPNIPFLADVSIRDHSSERGATCEVIKYIDEDKVNKQLSNGRPLGTWTPWNQCQTFAQEVLSNAGTGDYFGQDNRVTRPSWEFF